MFDPDLAESPTDTLTHEVHDGLRMMIEGRHRRQDRYVLVSGAHHQFKLVVTQSVSRTIRQASLLFWGCVGRGYNETIGNDCHFTLTATFCNTIGLALSSQHVGGDIGNTSTKRFLFNPAIEFDDLDGR